MNITWHGHSNFQIDAEGVNILIDPLFTNNPVCKIDYKNISKPDMVLVTHDHGDHVGDAVAICRETGASLVAVVGTAEKLIAEGVPQSQVPVGIGYNLGGGFTIKGVTVTMVPALHTSESGVPVGYIVRMPSGFTFYHAGDTCIYGDMALWGKLFAPELALLPIGDVFTMNASQAAMACAMLGVKKTIPMHFGTFPVLNKNAKAFKEALAKEAPDCECLEITPGQTITL